MIFASAREAEEVLITRHDHSLFVTAKVEMSFIVGGSQPRLIGGCHVYSGTSQGGRNGRINVLVEVEANAVRHEKGPATFPAAVRDCCCGRLPLRLPLDPGSGRFRLCDRSSRPWLHRPTPTTGRKCRQSPPALAQAARA